MTSSAYKCDFGAAEVDSSLGQIAGLDHVVVVGVVEQRLGRDAADVQAGAAQRVAAFDHGGFQAQLGAADGRHIAAGACAEDDHIIICHGYFL